MPTDKELRYLMQSPDCVLSPTPLSDEELFAFHEECWGHSRQPWHYVKRCRDNPDHCFHTRHAYLLTEVTIYLAEKDAHMSTINDYTRSVSEMSDEELEAELRRLRTERNDSVTRVRTAKKVDPTQKGKPSLKKIADNLSDKDKDELRSLFE